MLFKADEELVGEMVPVNQLLITVKLTVPISSISIKVKRSYGEFFIISNVVKIKIALRLKTPMPLGFLHQNDLSQLEVVYGVMWDDFALHEVEVTLPQLDTAEVLRRREVRS